MSFTFTVGTATTCQGCREETATDREKRQNKHTKYIQISLETSQHDIDAKLQGKNGSFAENDTAKSHLTRKHVTIAHL